MVLKFSTIPLHLQAKIAEKTDFWDLIQLQRSSKQGNKADSCIQIMPILEVTRIWIGHTCTQFSIKHPNNHDIQLKNWDEIIKHIDLRFSVGTVDIDYFADRESFHPLVDHKHRFIKNKIKLIWSYRNEDYANVIKELAECFDINLFVSNIAYPRPNQTEESRSFLSTPVFQQVEKFECPVFKVPGDILLSLNALEINVDYQQSEEFTVTSTLNKFFKQYFIDDRQIRKFHLTINLFEQICIEQMFFGLFYKLYWSLYMHERSEFGHIPKKDLFWNTQELEVDCVYLLRGGGKKLVVYVLRHSISAEETEDEYRTVRRFICGL